MLKALNHQLVDETLEDGRTVIKATGRCWKEIKLELAGDAVNVSLQDWQGNALPYEPILIRITGESAQGETLEIFEGECDDGIIPLDVYVAGDKLRIESLNENVENAVLEVEI
jgi:hypothetical protein